LRGEVGSETPDLQAGWLRVGGPQDLVQEVSEAVAALTPLPAAAWQGGIVLDFLAAPPATVSTGEPLPLTLGWRAGEQVARNLTLFVHLTDSTGAIVAQHDARPFAGRWPTPAWQAGDTLTEQIKILLPPDLPPGRYGLRLGFYDEAGRLPLADGQSDSWFLPEVVTVEP